METSTPDHEVRKSRPRRRGARGLLIACWIAGALSLAHGIGLNATFNGPPHAALTRVVAAAIGLGAPRPSKRQRTVIVVVDGLPDDRLSMLGLGAVRPDLPRARCTLQAGWPSYSRPNYVAISSGVPPQISGVHVNEHVGRAHLDSLWDAARRAGIETQLITDGLPWWRELYPDAWGQISEEANAVDAAVDGLFRRPGPALAVVHMVATDEAAHDYGLNSLPFRAAVTRAGSMISALLARAGADDLVVITSDHGHLASGGHGGLEPEVLAAPLLLVGRGVAATQVGECHGALFDLPATLAPLLGIAPPLHSVGVPRLDLLSHEAVDLARARRVSAAQRAAVAAAFGVSRADLASHVQGLWRRPALAPVLVSVAIWLAFSLLLWRLSGMKGRPTALEVVASSIFPTAVGVLLAIFERAFSLSAVWEVPPWLLQVIAVLFVAGVLGVLGLRAIRRRTPEASPAAVGALTMSFCALPLALGMGIHGSPGGGPVLGEPEMVYLMLVGDLIIAGAAVYVATLLRRKRKT